MKALKAAVVAALVALVAFPAAGQAPAKAPNRGARAVEALGAVTRGAGFSTFAGRFRVLGGVRAVERAAGQASAAAAAQLEALRPLGLGHHGPYLLYREAGGAPVASPRRLEALLTLAVVENLRTGGVGVLPGTLAVVLEGAFEPEVVAAAHGLTLVLAVPGSRTAVLGVKPGQDVLAAAEALARSGRVASVTVEVQEQFAQPL